MKIGAKVKELRVQKGLTQEELAERLNEAGFNVTQATVSRDIRELKLTKAPGKNGRQCYAVMQHQKDFGEKYIRIFRDCYVSMDMAQNILVIKTVSGMAMIKAYVLEKHGLKVSSLYISQVKRKCGLDVGQNYNLSKKEDAKVPQCPPEKEAAIMDALKHFQMI